MTAGPFIVIDTLILDKSILSKFKSAIRQAEAIQASTYLGVNKKNILPGISGPDIKDLDLLVKNFPNIKLQLPIESFWNSKDKIINKINNLSINSIFKKLKEDKISDINVENKFWKSFIEIIDNNNNYRIVLGVNSYKSVEKLKKITLNFNNIIK